MAATLHVKVQYGASGDPTLVAGDAANLNLLSVDNVSTTPADHPITVPTDGTNHSYERWFYILCDDLGGSERIQNLRIHASAAGGTGLDIKYGTTGNDTYVTPVDTSSTVADANIPTSLPGSANLAASAPGYLNDSTMDRSHWGVLQLHVGTTATAGESVTLTLTYDEVA